MFCPRSNQQSLCIGTFNGKFANIIELDISFGSVKDFPGASLHFKHLKKLIASNYQLTTFPDFGASAIEHLIEIDFSYNKFTELHSTAITGFRSLVTANLSHNQIIGLFSDIFVDSLELKVLDLSDNLITVFSADLFANHPTLEVLQLQNNIINELDRNVFSQSNLLELNLEYNLLLEFFYNGNTSQLRYLNIARNQIVHIFDRTLIYDNLKTLRIEANSVSDLQNVTTKKFPKLQTLGVGNNGVLCDDLKLFVQQWNDGCCVELIGNPWNQTNAWSSNVCQTEKETMETPFRDFWPLRHGEKGNTEVPLLVNNKEE